MARYDTQQITVDTRFDQAHLGNEGIIPGCNQFWDPAAARISPCYRTAVSAFPVGLAICILFGHIFRLVVPYRPQWSERFVREFDAPKRENRKRKKGPSLSLVGLLALSACGFVLQISQVVSTGFAISQIFGTLAWAVAGLLVATLRPRRTSLSILALYISVAISNATLMIDMAWPLAAGDVIVVVQFLLLLGTTAIILCMPMRDPRLPNDGIAPVYTSPTFELRTPEDNMTLLQFLTVSWMSPLISLGKERQINDEDVWSLGYEFRHRALHENFRELRGSVLQRLIKANIIDIVILSCISFVEIAAYYSVPVLLQQLLLSMENPATARSVTITYTALSLLARLVSAHIGVLGIWFGRRCYERSRGEMITMLYEKILVRKIVGAPLNSAEQGPDEKKDEAASTGKILNLMRNDVYEVAQRFWEIQSLLTKPLGLIVSVALIWRLIGWPCLIGLLTIITSQCINALLARALLKWERIRRKATDSRLQNVSQFVEAIRHLRWYGWEDTWLGQIMAARQKELNLKIICAVWRIAISFASTLGSGIFPVAAFWAYSGLLGMPLRIDIAFPALLLFDQLEGKLRDLPDLITALLNARVALGRLEDFMAEPDREGEVENATDDRRDDDLDGYAHIPKNLLSQQNTQVQEVREGEDPAQIVRLRLSNASFAWPGFPNPVLKDLTLSFPVGLTIVYGEVASGKTALLQAMLGELERLDGELIGAREVIGYCSQTPWLQSMSIRDNILFSEPYDEKRYRRVLEACALITDMANFKHGDLSNIGENGIGLSGGQKARVALARAVYSRANILLLDDPISALDYQTAEFIVRKCLIGPLMEDRTVVLATHRTELCQGLAEQFIEVSNGKTRVLEHAETLPGSLRRTLTSDSTNDGTQEMDKDKTLAAVPDKFIEEEHRAHGGVQVAIYWEYIKAGKLKLWLGLIVVMVLFRLINIAQMWFYKQWGESYTTSGGMTALSNAASNAVVSLWRGWIQTKVTKKGIFDDLPSPETNVRPWLVGITLLAITKALSVLVGNCFMVSIVYLAGKQIFGQVIERVSGATFRFYDVTPVGRLMNRLTSDIGTIDGNISGQFLQVAHLSITWIAAVIVIGSVTPLFLVFATLLTAAFVLIFLRFLPASQNLRRLEMVSLSPLISNFGTLLNGLITVRAFRVQKRFQDRVIAVTDTFQKMDHFYWALQAWLMYRFDILSACSTFLLTVLAVLTGVSPGLTAFVLDSANSFVTSTHDLCKLYGQLQMDFVSVERVVELLHLEQEGYNTVEAPAWWPRLGGDIVFDDVTIRYAPHLDPSLIDLSFRMKAGSRIAVVGRTGSGKSTLALALLATVLPDSGKILIDDMDISKVNAKPLRRRITFIAQDPILFPGSMHQNLDPLEEYTIADCELVLQKICGRYQWTLDTQIDTGGRNLSQGQRQLIGLARTLLRKSPIVILDEATASIDMETAMKTQQILDDEMKDSTIITIAHRLEAVKNADYCIVLDKGRIIRQGRAVDILGEAENNKDK